MIMSFTLPDGGIDEIHTHAFLLIDFFQSDIHNLLESDGQGVSVIPLNLLGLHRFFDVLSAFFIKLELWSDVICNCFIYQEFIRNDCMLVLIINSFYGRLDRFNKRCLVRFIWVRQRYFKIFRGLSSILEICVSVN